MERGLMMVVHSALIGVILYLAMRYLLNQNPMVAEDRSVLVAGIVLVYMVLFGHSLPGKINSNIMG